MVLRLFSFFAALTCTTTAALKVQGKQRNPRQKKHGDKGPVEVPDEDRAKCPPRSGGALRRVGAATGPLNDLISVEDGKGPADVAADVSPEPADVAASPEPSTAFSVSPREGGDFSPGDEEYDHEDDWSLVGDGVENDEREVFLANDQREFEVLANDQRGGADFDEEGPLLRQNREAEVRPEKRSSSPYSEEAPRLAYVPTLAASLTRDLARSRFALRGGDASFLPSADLLERPSQQVPLTMRSVLEREQAVLLWFRDADEDLSEFSGSVNNAAFAGGGSPETEGSPAEHDDHVVESRTLKNGYLVLVCPDGFTIIARSPYGELPATQNLAEMLHQNLVENGSMDQFSAEEEENGAVDNSNERGRSQRERPLTLEFRTPTRRTSKSSFVGVPRREVWVFGQGMITLPVAIDADGFPRSCPGCPASDRPIRFRGDSLSVVDPVVPISKLLLGLFADVRRLAPPDSRPPPADVEEPALLPYPPGLYDRAHAASSCTTDGDTHSLGEWLLRILHSQKRAGELQPILFFPSSDEDSKKVSERSDWFFFPLALLRGSAGCSSNHRTLMATWSEGFFLRNDKMWPGRVMVEKVYKEPLRRCSPGAVLAGAPGRASGPTEQLDLPLDTSPPCLSAAEAGEDWDRVLAQLAVPFDAIMAKLGREACSVQSLLSGVEKKDGVSGAGVEASGVKRDRRFRDPRRKMHIDEPSFRLFVEAHVWGDQGS